MERNADACFNKRVAPDVFGQAVWFWGVWLRGSWGYEERSHEIRC